MYDQARVWRFTGNPLGHGGLRFIGNPAGGSEERQDPVTQRAVYGRPDHAMVGRVKRKGVSNIYFTRKTRTCIRFVLEGRLVLVGLGLLYYKWSPSLVFFVGEYSLCLPLKPAHHSMIRPSINRQSGRRVLLLLWPACRITNEL